jgi:uncharacterized ferritin-like protein (DUF455 family)
MRTYSEYADFILNSPSLEAKLTPPPEAIIDDCLEPDFADSASRRIQFRDEPVRSEGIQMSDTKMKIPRLEHLNDPRNVAISLHHFANHELMAIELFAWALLKFKDASSGIRKGFLISLNEEQKHFLLYRSRMEELGVGFGDRPVNRLFWKQIPKMQTLERFAAILSVSFEGANLDYSIIYKQAFLFHEDEKTANIMQTVFEDEIRHVKRGVAILKKYQPDSMTDWEYYTSLLEFPLTPRRAKGYYYLPESRRKVGLSENFIQELGNYEDIYTDRVNLSSLEKIGFEVKPKSPKDLS